MFQYKSTEQISEIEVVKPHVYPKYPKSTTDPTYYEPAATRIANMKKASGAQLEGIYDFYEKSDVEKFNKDNFGKNIQNVMPDPMFQKGLTREEVSQVTNTMSQKAQDTVDKKKADTQTKKARIDETIATAKVIQNNNTSEE